MLDKLKEIYYEWNQQKITFENFDSYIEITTPFVDMHHDYIQLFLSKENNQYIISDDGYTINELDMLGIDIKKSKKRKEFFNSTLKIFGVSFNNNTDELYVSFTPITEYPEKQHRLIQCILRVSDMLLTSRNTVISIFTEEIGEFFDNNEIIYTDGLSFTGISGKTQNFDFVLPRWKKRNEKLIKAINNPSSDSYVEPLFSWLDIREIRSNSDYIILANDTNKPLTESFLSPFNNYSVEVLAWSKRNEWVDKFKIS